MNKKEQKEFDVVYKELKKILKLQGKSPKTVDSYSRAVRRLANYFDQCPLDATRDEMRLYFADLVDRYSWSTIKIDRNCIMFFWKYILHGNAKKTLKLIQLILYTEVPFETEPERPVFKCPNCGQKMQLIACMMSKNTELKGRASPVYKAA